MKKNLTFIALVAAGVFAAGYLMNQFSDIDIVDQARNGFDS